MSATLPPASPPMPSTAPGADVIATDAVEADDAHAEAVHRATAWYGHSRAIFSGGNDVQLLRGGDALFPAMCEAIRQAQREVWLATYIFQDDPAGLSVAQALIDAAARGVQVRLVVDGFGCIQSLDGLRRVFGGSAVEMAVFRPVTSWWSWLQPGTLRRLHQKLCVVDQTCAFVGGINVLDDRHDLHHGWSELPRLDYAVVVRGPVVTPVEQTARAMWTRATLGRDWRDEFRQIARSRRPVASARSLLRRLQMARKQAAQHRANRPTLPPMRAAFVVRDNLRQRRSIERTYIDALGRATERIDIVCAYFYPGLAFRRALHAAAQRGVKVRLLLQGKVDYRFARLAAEALYNELLARGVRIFEYTPAFLHAKVALVDRHWATVGSSNIDPLSLLVNLEANVVVEDAGFVETMAAELERDFSVAAEVVAPPPLAGWRRWLRRGIVAWVARLYLQAAGATGRY